MEKVSQVLHLRLRSLEQEGGRYRADEEREGKGREGHCGSRACESAWHLSATLKFPPLTPVQSEAASVFTPFSTSLCQRERD